MFGLVLPWVRVLVRLFRSQRSLLIENLALRQQLAVFKRQNSRPQTGRRRQDVLGVASPLLVFVEDGASLSLCLVKMVSRFNRFGSSNLQEQRLGLT